MDIAAHWLKGEMQYLALNQSTLIAARLPLFPLLLSGDFRVSGVSIYSLRLFTALLGVLSVALVYGYVRASRADRALALLAALLLAIYSEAVIYARVGFMVNLLTPLALLSAIWCGVCRCWRSRLCPTLPRCCGLRRRRSYSI